MSNTEDARVKMLLRYKKQRLIRIAADYDLDVEGTKFVLACRIAERQCADAQKTWDAIVGKQVII